MRAHPVTNADQLIMDVEVRLPVPDQVALLAWQDADRSGRPQTIYRTGDKALPWVWADGRATPLNGTRPVLTVIPEGYWERGAR